MRTLLATAILGLPAAVLGQGKVLVVDVTGQAGPYKTIMSAVNVAQSGDQIRIHPGDYQEFVVVDGKAITLLGVGKKASEVVVSGSSIVFRGTMLTIKNLPKGGRMVVSRISLGGPLSIFLSPRGFVIENSAGEIAIEELVSKLPNSCSNVAGTVAIHRCELSTALSGGASGGSVLNLANVQLSLIQSSSLKNTWSGLGPHCTGLTAANTALDISGSVFLGAYGAQGIGPLVYSGGHGIWLDGCTAFLRGSAKDTVTGGSAPIGMGSPADGGDAIHMNNSKLSWSGVTMIAGVGNTTGKQLYLVGSTAMQVVPDLPTLTSNASFAAGVQTSFQVQAAPSSVSVTWLTLGVRPFATPLGFLVADLQTLLMPLAVAHDSQGLATLSLDLRQIDPRHVGDAFVLQVLCLDPQSRFGLSNALVNIVH